MTEKTKLYAVRSDVHARVDLAGRQLEVVKTGRYAGLFDLGDLEAKHIGVDHLLRANQGADENTMEAIVRNALDADGALTQDGKQAVDDTLSSLEYMQEHLERVRDSGIFYRGIAGNSREAWTNVFDAITTPAQRDELRQDFDVFDENLITEAGVDFFTDGRLYTRRDFSKRPDTAVIYLPWNASMDSVRGLSEMLNVHDLSKIVILSHDYLTRESLSDELRDKIKPMQNEEQVLTVLDDVCQRDGAEIIGLYGHIGLEYGPFKQEFRHGNTTVNAYHMDEKEGGLFELNL